MKAFLWSPKARLAWAICAAFGILDSLCVYFMRDTLRNGLKHLPEPIAPDYARFHAFWYGGSGFLLLVAIAATIIYWASRPPRTEVQESTKLVLLIMAVVSLEAWLLGWLFKI